MEITMQTRKKEKVLNIKCPKRDRHEKHWKFNGTQHKLIFEICSRSLNLLRVRVFWDIWIECLKLVTCIFYYKTTELSLSNIQ